MLRTPAHSHCKGAESPQHPTTQRSSSATAVQRSTTRRDCSIQHPTNSPNNSRIILSKGTVIKVKVRKQPVRTDDFSCMYLFWSCRGVANRTDREMYFLATRCDSDEKPGHSSTISEQFVVVNANRRTKIVNSSYSTFPDGRFTNLYLYYGT